MQSGAQMRNTQLRKIILVFLWAILSLGFNEIACASPAVFRKGPYLLYGGDRGAMTVVWQTDKTPTVSSTIEWGLASEYGNGPFVVLENTSATDEHLFRYSISSVDDATEVFYRIVVDGDSYTGSFRTAPSLDVKDISFYGYGDTRGSGNLLTDTYYQNHDKVEAAIMRDLAGDPSKRQTIAIDVGDFVYYGMEEDFWDAQYFNRSLTGTLNFQAHLPILGAIGNHEGSYLNSISPSSGLDNASSPGALYYKYWPFPMYPQPKGVGAYSDYFYYFDYGPVRFFMLDTSFSSWSSDSYQMQWLRQNIRTSTPWNIVVTHIPLWSPTYNHGKEESLLRREVLDPILKEKHVPLVLHGHEHYYSRIEKDGIVYQDIAGGGAPFHNPGPPYDLESAPYVKFTQAILSFARYDIHGDQMDVSVFDRDNNVIDSFSLYLNGTPAPTPTTTPIQTPPATIAPTSVPTGCVTKNVTATLNRSDKYARAILSAGRQAATILSSKAKTSTVAKTGYRDRLDKLNRAYNSLVRAQVVLPGMILTCRANCHRVSLESKKTKYSRILSTLKSQALSLAQELWRSSSGQRERGRTMSYSIISSFAKARAVFSAYPRYTYVCP